MASTRVDVVTSRGCGKLFVGTGPSIRSLSSLGVSEATMSVASPAVSEPVAGGPFSGLVICVTGLSKEARKQVMEATERLGGQYSPSLHPQCTHLVVQSLTGRKFDHALKHGARNGLLVVTLGWFVDSVRRNVRLNESMYMVKCIGDKGVPLGELNAEIVGTGRSCIPMASENQFRVSTSNSYIRPSTEHDKSNGLLFSDTCIYIDPKTSTELKKKVIEAATRRGASFLDHWFIGCHATHVVCEVSAIQKYLGHASNLITPLWILKTAKENYLQRLVHLSSDLARQASLILENTNLQDAIGELTPPDSCKRLGETCEERRKMMELAKLGVRNRRSRRMQSCQIPIYPITPPNLLESICWSISEPASSACIYMESSPMEDAREHRMPTFPNAEGDSLDSEASFENFTRPLRESEKAEVILKSHFLTILFPLDRFGELGPSSRTFFSDGGFTCSQVLEDIYDFYQEYMSPDEIKLAIHTDSRHADRLRLLYASKESIDQGVVAFKRIDFLGSRKSFESLKRNNGENNNCVYELLIRS